LSAEEALFDESRIPDSHSAVQSFLHRRL